MEWIVESWLNGARCRSMNPGRELASCLEPPRAMGFDNEQRSKMGDAMPTN